MVSLNSFQVSNDKKSANFLIFFSRTLKAIIVDFLINSIADNREYFLRDIGGYNHRLKQKTVQGNNPGFVKEFFKGPFFEDIVGYYRRFLNQI